LNSILFAYLCLGLMYEIWLFDEWSITENGRSHSRNHRAQVGGNGRFGRHLGRDWI